jgi:2-polyprenyl-6-methoxyphenol hydroxylase-like FAD-dependent oxidoreductase
MTKVRSALVIGGGIAGPVMAMALAKAGIEATVYEAYPTMTEGIGGGLTLGANGLAALEHVGVRDEVEAAGLPIVSMVMSFGDKQIAIPQLENVAPGMQVQRDDLHRILHDAARAQGIGIEYGKRLAGAEQDDAGVTARFADGTSARGDILIGADGVHSTVRTLIDPNAPGPDYTGILGFDIVVDRPVPSAAGIQHFAFGKRAYYLYWREADGRTRLGINLPHEAPMRLTEARAVPTEQWLRTLRETYGQDDPGGDLVRAIDPDRMQVTGSIYIMPSVPNWHRGRMVLVGDAVHAPSNSSGQGASLSIESALELARALRDLPSAHEAFTAYEQLRRPRVEKIAAQAKRVNQVKSPGPVMRAIMPLLMRAFMKVAMNPEKNFGPTLRYRIDWDAPVAPQSARG